jgi:catechol 2,3-dioxygenase-like lactoylglutathione lyase family enzyme
MSSTQASDDTATAAPGATGVPMRFEVLPVADDDRAKAFYERLGWRLDADFPLDERFRVVQLTPPGSHGSIQFGKGTTTMAPRSDGREPGPDPDRGSYRTFASFRDPDGNSWLLQEIKERLPGRV